MYREEHDKTWPLRTSYHRAVPKRPASSVWISIDMEGIGGVAAYSHMAELAMVRIAPSTVPPEQS